MNAGKFNDEIVIPTLQEFHDEFGCVRRAFLAVAVVDALAAHVFYDAGANDIDPFDFFVGRYVHRTSKNGKVIEKDIDARQHSNVPESEIHWSSCYSERQRTDTYFREMLADSDDAYRTVRDLAKANKHAVLTRNTKRIMVKESSDVAAKLAPSYQGEFGVARPQGCEQVMVSIMGADPKSGAETKHDEHLEPLLYRAYDKVIWSLELLDRKSGRQGDRYDWHERLATK